MSDGGCIVLTDYGMVVWYGTIPYHCEYGTVHDEGGWHEPGVQRLQTIPLSGFTMAQNVLVPSCRVERTRTVFLTVLLALYSLCYITEKYLFWIYSYTE